MKTTHRGIEQIRVHWPRDETEARLIAHDMLRTQLAILPRETTLFWWMAALPSKLADQKRVGVPSRIISGARSLVFVLRDSHIPCMCSALI